jgi:hypothetical protein
MADETAKERMKRLRERRAAAGQKPQQLWLTDAEHRALKDLLANHRAAICSIVSALARGADADARAAMAEAQARAQHERAEAAEARAAELETRARHAEGTARYWRTSTEEADRRADFEGQKGNAASENERAEAAEAKARSALEEIQFLRGVLVGLGYRE